MPEKIGGSVHEWFFLQMMNDLKLIIVTGLVCSACCICCGLWVPLPYAHPNYTGQEEEEAVPCWDIRWGGELVGGVEEPLGGPVLSW